MTIEPRLRVSHDLETFRPRVDYNMPSATYNDMVALRSGDLKFLVDNTPAQFEARKQLSSEALLLGLATHCMILTAADFEEEFAILPTGLNMKSPKDRLFVEEYSRLNEDRHLLRPDMVERALRMADAVMSHPEARMLLEGSLAEVSIIQRRPHPLGGAPIMTKCRIDAIPHDYPYLLELKTSRDASWRGFRDAIETMHYDLSAWMYRDMANQQPDLLDRMLGGGGFESVVMIAVENEEPHQVAVYELLPGFMETGKELHDAALLRYAHVLQARALAQRPDGYANGIQPMGPSGRRRTIVY